MLGECSCSALGTVQPGTPQVQGGDAWRRWERGRHPDVCYGLDGGRYGASPEDGGQMWKVTRYVLYMSDGGQTWKVTLMCVMCVGLWVDMDSHPDVRLCCIVCCTYWIVGRRGNVTQCVSCALDRGQTWTVTPMHVCVVLCVVRTGLWVDAGMSPNVCHVRWIAGRHGQSPRCISVLYCVLYVLDCGQTRECHPICVICVGLWVDGVWVDVGMSPVCVICQIVGRPGASPHGAMWGEWPLHYYQPFIPL